VDGNEQRDRHAEPQNPPARREQRHVKVIQDEDLVAQDGQSIQVVRAFVVRDRGHRGLKPRDVRFQRDGHLVAEPTLNPRADCAQKPCCSGRNTEANRRCQNEPRPVPENAASEEHQPEGQQCVGQRGQLRQHERGQHQPRLVPVSELAQPPHRGDRRRELLARGPNAAIR
jgi:hypothetical protein